MFLNPFFVVSIHPLVYEQSERMYCIHIDVGFFYFLLKFGSKVLRFSG